MYGVIKRIILSGGYGFIRPDGEAVDLFFHAVAVEDPSFSELQEGQLVTFDVYDDTRRNQKRAVNIRCITPDVWHVPWRSSEIKESTINDIHLVWYDCEDTREGYYVKIVAGAYLNDGTWVGIIGVSHTSDLSYRSEADVAWDVYENGSGLTEDQARAYFPEIKLRYLN